MRTISTLLRGKIPLLATASATAALALVAIVPVAATASTTPSARPYFMPWKLGTPLPVMPAGYTREAMPSQASIARIGAQFQPTPVALPANGTAAAVASAAAAATKALAPNANSAGYVNLEATPVDIGASCVIAHTGDDGQFINAVAQSYITDPKDNMGFTYGGNQSSSVTVGLSYSNAYGSFSASGTSSVSSGAVQPFPYQIGVNNVYWRTYFLWGHYRETCVSKFTSIWWFSQPRAWVISDNVYHPAHGYGWKVCGPESAGLTPSVNHTTATTITTAFNNTSIGFEGDSQTGYSTTASINYYYGENGWLCGQYDYNQGGAIGVPTAIP